MTSNISDSLVRALSFDYAACELHELQCHKLLRELHKLARELDELRSFQNELQAVSSKQAASWNPTIEIAQAISILY